MGKCEVRNSVSDHLFDGFVLLCFDLSRVTLSHLFFQGINPNKLN